MAVYIYTWNPEKWRWADLQDAIYQVNNGEDYEMFWSCGNTKRIQPGDPFPHQGRYQAAGYYRLRLCQFGPLRQAALG